MTDIGWQDTRLKTVLLQYTIIIIIIILKPDSGQSDWTLQCRVRQLLVKLLLLAEYPEGSSVAKYAGFP